MTSVLITLFIDTLIDNGASHTIDKDGEVTTHFLSYKGNTMLIPLINDEHIHGHEAAIILTELGMLYLLPYLVPDHPAAEFAKSLPRD